MHTALQAPTSAQSLSAALHDLPVPSLSALAHSAPATGASSLLLQKTRPGAAPGPLHCRALHLNSPPSSPWLRPLPREESLDLPI